MSARLPGDQEDLKTAEQFSNGCMWSSCTLLRELCLNLSLLCDIQKMGGRNCEDSHLKFERHRQLPSASEFIEVSNPTYQLRPEATQSVFIVGRVADA